MPFVITEKCAGERYANCAAVCPVDCIHPVEHAGRPYMVIDPAACIDCEACLPACPINAIVSTIAEDPAAAQLNRLLTPAAIAWEAVHGPAPARPCDEAPRRPDNALTRFVRPGPLTGQLAGR